jgi:signal recognition particle GTPase
LALNLEYRPYGTQKKKKKKKKKKKNTDHIRELHKPLAFKSVQMKCVTQICNLLCTHTLDKKAIQLAPLVKHAL